MFEMLCEGGSKFYLKQLLMFEIEFTFTEELVGDAEHREFGL